MSAIVDIAETVRATIAATHLGQTKVVTRAWHAEFEPGDLSTLHVVVIPESDDFELVSRRSTSHDWSVLVRVLKKVANNDNATIDPLAAVVEQLADLFLFDETLVLSDPNITTLYSRDDLTKKRQFTAEITLRFRGSRTH